MASIQPRYRVIKGVKSDEVYTYDIRWLEGGKLYGTVEVELRDAQACKAFVEARAERGQCTPHSKAEPHKLIAERRYLNVREEDLGEVIPRAAREPSTGIALGELFIRDHAERKNRSRKGKPRRSDETVNRMNLATRKNFADWWGRRASSITPAMMNERWREWVDGGKLKESTSSLYMGYLRSSLTWGYRQGYVKGAMPNWDLLDFSTASSYHRDITPFDDDELPLLFGLCPDACTEAMAKALDSSGMRIGELLALAKESIDKRYPNGSARVFIGHHMVGAQRRAGTKTGPRKTRHSFFDAPTMEALAPFLEGKPGSPIFPSERGGYYTYSAWKSTVWGPVVAAVNADPKLRRTNSAGDVVSFGPHLLRHGFATREANEKGTTPFQLMKVLGHESLATVMGYYRSDSSDVAEQMANRKP